MGYQNRYSGGGVAQVVSVGAAGKWVSGPAASTSAANSANSTVYGNVFLVPAGRTIDRLGVKVAAGGTAASTIRLGVYNVDDGGRPTSLLGDFGTVAADGIATVETATIATPVGPVRADRLVWLAAGIENAASPPQLTRYATGAPSTPIVAGIDSLAQLFAANYHSFSFTPGSLPSTAGTIAATTFSPVIAARLA